MIVKTCTFRTNVGQYRHRNDGGFMCKPLSQ